MKTVRRRSKKAQDGGTRTFVQIIFFVLLFFIAYKLVTMLLGSFVRDAEQGTIKSMERLQIEMNSMTKEKAIVPIYIDATRKLQGFSQNTVHKKCTDGISCICMCIKDSPCINNAIKDCVPLSVTLDEEFTLDPRIIDEKPITYNCELYKKEEKVGILCHHASQ